MSSRTRSTGSNIHTNNL